MKVIGLCFVWCLPQESGKGVVCEICLKLVDKSFVVSILREHSDSGLLMAFREPEWKAGH